MFRILFSIVILWLIATVSMGFLHAEWEVVSGEYSSVSGEPRKPKPIPRPREKETRLIELRGGLTKPTYILREFSDDASTLRFVSRDVPLTDEDYKPENLMRIAGDNINEAGRVWYLRGDAHVALGELAQVFSREFQTPLVVISGYRSAAYQRQLWARENYCTETLCALPGRSEHQLWLAIDVFDATNEHDFIANRNYQRYVAWFQANAHLHGWHQSYQKWVEIDGYMVEPWHWRYVWVDMATRLHNLGWTYTEYVEFQNWLVQYW